MDQNWLYNLNNNTAVIVPTRSLANALGEQIANHHISCGDMVWEPPTILLWRDYLRLLWQQNRAKVARRNGAQVVISERQSTLLWTQVVESSRRQEQALTLLDVQQTVKAVQRSWRLINDWQVDVNTLQDDHVADTEQFIIWINEYQSLLNKRGMMDESQLQQVLLEINTAPVFKTLIWYSYDLVTTTQRAFIAQGVEQSKDNGCEHRFESITTRNEPQQQLVEYANGRTELLACLHQARKLIEDNPEHDINIVIPDLQHRQASVRSAAREVFYPGLSPIEVQLMPTVYRFSLGEPLQQWPAIETALRLIKLLNNRTTVAELSFVLRNRFLQNSQQLQSECRLFERWLKRQRLRRIFVDHLPDLYQQCLDYFTKRQQAPAKATLLSLLEDLVNKRQQLQQTLQQQKDQNGYAAIGFSEWVAIFDEWFTAWGWHTSVIGQEFNSVQYQLHQRWGLLLEEFAGLGLVQKQVGLNRALEILRQMTRESIFQPQAVASPILISGVFEAIGRPVDTCFLLSMDQTYPAQPQADAFLPNRLMRDVGFPDASADTSFQLAKQVSDNLLAAAKHQIISYSRQHDRDREIENQVSPLFRGKEFRGEEFKKTDLNNSQHTALQHDQCLERYSDTQGPVWSSAKHAKGGHQIFQHQSVCAFRAFATHRLGFLRDDEAEFGLDALDRGNIVHDLLERIWGQLATQDQLLNLSEESLNQLIEETVEQTVSDPTLNLSDDKVLLLQHEQPRLCAVLKNWLEHEKRRPIGFSVVEREESHNAEIGGIHFNYIVDRLDITDDGRSLIIDYKTGSVDRKDWLGDRLVNPQLPLYAVAHDMQKRKAISGISFARVEQLKPEFVELSEVGILKPNNRYTLKYEEQWTQQREKWPAYFEQLAVDFLQGEASVNPIDEKTCRYCELKSVCRVSQLRDQSDSSNSDISNLDISNVDGEAHD